jgi:hypothetical protein
MSQDAVARFLELVESDGTVEAALNAAAERQADVAAAAVGLGEQHGLEFTSQEFMSAVKAFHDEHPGRLDDAELMGVRGGLNPCPEPPSFVTPWSDPPWFSQQWASRLVPGGGPRPR